MKQRITIEQLNELTEPQKQRLQDRWKIDQEYGLLELIVNNNQIVIPDEYDEDKGIFNYAAWEAHKSECLPLLSVGQMFEILADIKEAEYLNEIDVAIEMWTPDDTCDELWKLMKKNL